MSKYRIIIPQGMGVQPEQFELSAANILLGHFRSDIEFIPVSSSKTPDILVGNVRWEIKSPTGRGKYTIQHQFHRASKQSMNIIIDARRCGIHIVKIRKEIAYQVGLAKGIRRVVLIEKTGKVVVVK